MLAQQLSGPPTASVGMGQIALARKPDRLGAVLGSCVGVALWHARLAIGALAHVVLPDSHGQAVRSAKFADLAVPLMLEQLEQQGALRSGLVAKLAGGACMFGNPSPLQIGQANVEAVTRALQKLGIPIVSQDVGGKSGRRIILDCSTGELIVEIAGGRPHVL